MARHAVDVSQLMRVRSWSKRRLRSLLSDAMRGRLVREAEPGKYCLTKEGVDEARRIARNHRLWELYLIHYADIAPTHVDRDADRIEHLLEPEMLAELESMLAKYYPGTVVPPSPHALEHAR
jgi:manganese/zinc/iron transport system permease protein